MEVPIVSNNIEIVDQHRISIHNKESSLEIIKRVAEAIFWLIAGMINFLIDCFTQPLADFLCLETLRHGTSWSNYIKIRMYGPDPTLGGGITGATFGHKVSKVSTISDAEQDKFNRYSKGKFFAFVDTAGSDVTYLDEETHQEIKKTYSGLRWCYEKIHIRVAPHTYGFGAGAACAPNCFPEGNVQTVWRFVNGVASFFSPTVKIRITPDKLKELFKVDSKLPERAVYTRCAISTDYLGLSGIFKQASEGSIGTRMRNNPGKCLWGAIRVINPISLLLLGGFGIYYAFRPAKTILATATI